MGKKIKVRVTFSDDDGNAESRTSAAYPSGTVGDSNAPTGADKTVTLAEDGSYAFKAADFGFADSDTGDALSSVKVATLPASGKGTLALDGTAVTAGQSVTKADLDAGDLAFEPAAHGHGDPYATFTFKVSDGILESASAYTMTVDVTAVNDAATGAPTISGTARVGRTLTASKSTVADADGLTRAEGGEAGHVYSWQWIRVDGETETAISGATSKTYTLVAADVGKKFKAKLSFTDDDGNAESRTSAVYPAAQAAPIVANTAPTGADKTVTLAEDGSYAFKAADFGFADSDTGDALSSVKIMTLPSPGTLALDGTTASTDQVIAAADLGKLTFEPAANGHGDLYATFTFKVSDGTTESASAYTMTVDVTAVNDVATGAPAISGTARKGLTLIASKSTVADADGLTRAERGEAGHAYSWHWLRVDGATERAISAATSKTYTLVAADVGKKIKVRVTFSDDDGNAESRTSAAYPSGGTVVGNGVPTIEDGKLRLVDGQVPHEGRLEIFHDGEWGTICDDYWSKVEADLACKLLGYPTGSVEDAGRFREAFFGRGTGPIVLDNMSCSGNEPGLLQCPRVGGLAVREHNCSHKEDVGVRCNIAPWLVDIELSSSSGDDGGYDRGETVELTLVWSEPVIVETPAGGLPPKLWLLVYGDSESGKDMFGKLSPVYSRGSGTARMVFEYTLGSDESWTDGLAGSFRNLKVERNTLKLRDGRIRSKATGARAVLGHGEYRWALPRTASLQTTAPAVTAVPRVSGPGSDGVFAAGDRIEAWVAFDAAVTVDTSGGVPALGVALGGVRRDAAYESGSGTAQLVFALSVAEADAGAPAARAVANGLVLNGATIRSADGADAVLDYGTAPGVVSVTITDAPGGDGRWGPGEAVELRFVFAEPVVVDTSGGTPSVGLALPGLGARQAAYAGGSGTSELSFSRTVAADEAAVSSVLVPPDALALNGGTIRSTGGLDALLGHDGTGRAAIARSVLPSLSVADATASEGGTLTFRVTLAPAAPAPVTVAWATADGPSSGGAAAGSDYTAASGKLAFAAGETEKTVEVAVLADSETEGAETLTLALSNPAGAAIGDGEATGTVTDGSGPAALTASFHSAPPEHDGSAAFTLELRFSEEPAGLSYRTVRDSLFAVTGGAVTGARRLAPPSNLRYELTVAPSGDAAVTLALAALPACGETGSVCTADGTALSGPLTATVPGPAALSVADANVEEAPGAVLAFAVTLDRARHAAVTVDYATSDGTAVAGADYTADSGALTFAAGETSKTVEVTVLDDGHDEGSETLTLTLSNPGPSTVRLEDATATGTITNSDAIPKAWIARFGRTVAEQVLDAVEGRMRATPVPGVEVALAGERIGGQPEPGSEEERDARREEEARRDAQRFADWLRGETDPEEAQRGMSRAVTPRDLLTGSSFALTSETAGEELVSLWGRGAVTRFDGREAGLTLDGEVVTGMLGADWTQRRWTAGLIVSHSVGEGGYSDGSEPGARSPASSGGRVEATLTGVFPWARRALTERLEAWGAAGYGQGELTVTPKMPGTDQDGAAMRADLDLWMAAAGLRGVLLDPESGSGFQLTGKTDAKVVQTASERGRGAGAGNLEPARARVTLLRLGLEGSRPVRLGGGAVLTPSLQIGVRHDGGDAETGFGLDLVGGLALSDPRRGFEVELRGRGLLAHESKDFRERGLSGALAWQQKPSSDRGAKLKLTQTIGGSSSGGADVLLSRTTLDGLAANGNDEGGNDDLKSRRLELRLGYGFSAFGDRFTWTPEVGVGLSDTGRDYSLGWRLVRGGSGGDGGSLELSFEARRRESANDNADPEHMIVFKLGARF